MMENLGIHQLFSPGTDAAVRVSPRELGQFPDKKAQGIFHCSSAEQNHPSSAALGSH